MELHKDKKYPSLVSPELDVTEPWCLHVHALWTSLPASPDDQQPVEPDLRVHVEKTVGGFQYFLGLV